MLEFIQLMKKEFPKRGWVLDIGCGDGRNSIPFAEAGFKVHAIDRDANEIKALLQRTKSSKSKNIFAQAGDFRNIKFKKKYAVILCSGVLHTLSEKGVEDFIRKMKRITEENGFHYVSVQLKHPKVTKVREHRLFDKMELKKRYGDWSIVAYAETPLRLDSGHPFSQDPRFRKAHYHKNARLIARKNSRENIKFR